MIKYKKVTHRSSEFPLIKTYFTLYYMPIYILFNIHYTYYIIKMKNERYTTTIIHSLITLFLNFHSQYIKYLKTVLFCHVIFFLGLFFLDSIKGVVLVKSVHHLENQIEWGMDYERANCRFVPIRIQITSRKCDL